MFSIFAYLSVSDDSKVSLNTQVSNNAFFEILDIGGKSVTKDGFYLAFRYYDVKDQQYKLKTQRTDFGVMTIPDIAEIRVTQSNADSEYYWLPKLKLHCNLAISVSNLQKVNPLQYDLGIYAEMPSGSSFKRVMHNNAIEVRNGDTKYHRILLKDQHYPDVSTIYIGPTDATDGRYWKDTQSKDPTSTDTAYAFSWKQRTVSDSEILGCTIFPSEDHLMEVILKDRTENKNTQPRSFDAKLEIIDYSTTTKEYEIDEAFQPIGPNYKRTDPNEYKATITQHFNFAESKNQFIKKLNVFDYPDTTRPSNFIYLAYFLEGATRPQFTWENEPANEYELGQSIRIKATINEDVRLKYRLNGGAIQDLTTDKEITSGFTSFDTTIPLTGLEAGTSFEFILIALDNSHDITLAEYKKQIRIRSVQTTTIHSDFSSFQRVLPGEKVVIFGEVSDSKESTKIIISAGWNNQNALSEITSVSYENKIKTFSGYFEIPTGATAGKYTIYLQASAGSSKSDMKSIGVTVVSSEAPQPAQITQITEDSSSIKGNSAFNLKYSDKGLSHNNEGFYVAYRLYDEQQNAARSDIHYVKKNNNNQDTTDKVTVKYMGSTDEYSKKYFQARFNVTNDGYYDQLIDLSVFVDSDFGQQDQEISMRPDGTGIIVSDESQKLYYTVFTSYGEYPDVSYINIDATVARESDTEIPLEKMPFFTLRQTKLYKGNDPMYSLSWIRQNIPAGQSVVFALTFAGYDIIKSPSKIVKEISEVKEVYSKSDHPTLTFKVSDENINEQLSYVLKVNNVEKKKGNIKVKRAAEPVDYTFDDGLNDDVVQYSFTVTDSLNYATVSSGKLITYDKPKLSIEMNSDFIKGAVIPVNATIKHSHDGKIMYQWGKNARVETLKSFTKSSQMESSTTNITHVESLQVRRLPYPLIFWAEDENGVKSEEITKYVFFDNPNKPVLSMVGLSKKSARPSAQMIGFAVVKDDTQFRTVQLYYRIGNEGEFIPVQGATHELETTTEEVFPFYWSVPAGTEHGVKDVYFRVKDSSGQFSDEMPSVTLNVAN